MHETPRLKIGEEGIVGYAIAKNEPRIAMDVGKDAVHFKNPDHTKYSLRIGNTPALGGKVIGAFDVQSEKEALSNDDVRISHDHRRSISPGE
jgi:hypothetical protein